MKTVIFLSLIFSAALSLTCSQHPFLDKVKALSQELNDTAVANTTLRNLRFLQTSNATNNSNNTCKLSDKYTQQDFTNEWNAFAARTASAPTGGLGYCKQFANVSKTCCTQDTVCLLKALAMRRFRSESKKPNIYIKILKLLNQGLQKCAKKDAKASNTTNTTQPAVDTEGQQITKDSQQQQSNIALGSVKFLRGNLCILCADPDTASSFVSNSTNKTKVNQDDLNAYLDLLSENLASMDELKTKFSTYINSKIDAAGTSTCYTKLKEKIAKILADGNFSPCGGKSDKTNCKSTISSETQLFGNGPAARAGKGDKISEKDLTEGIDTLRFLQTTSGDVEACTPGSSGCLSTYVADSEDKQVAIDGNVASDSGSSYGVNIFVATMALVSLLAFTLI